MLIGWYLCIATSTRSGVIVGAVFGVLVGVVLTLILTAVVVFFIHRRKRNKRGMAYSMLKS